jgi:sugar fermentation stimulation protein A
MAGKNANRKTAYDLIAVEKNNGRLINIDSQIPNVVMKEWLSSQNCSVIIPEYTYGRSRLDFYFETGGSRYLMEVKGCTLEVDGYGYFPDAPTTRGVKHLNELISAAGAGYKTVLAFVIQMDGVETVFPNRATDPDFADAMLAAVAAGVEIHFMHCHVEPDLIEIVSMSVYDAAFS